MSAMPLLEGNTQASTEPREILSMVDATNRIFWWLDMFRYVPKRAMTYFGMTGGELMENLLEQASEELVAQEVRPTSADYTELEAMLASTASSFSLMRVRIVATLFTALAIQIYVSGTAGPCVPSENARWQCDVWQFAQHAGAILVILALNAVVYGSEAGIRYAWGQLYKHNRVRALELQAFCTSKIMDRLKIGMMPNAYGNEEDVILSQFFVMVLMFLLFGLIDFSTGVISLGLQISMYFLILSNAIIGENAAMDNIMKTEVVSRALAVAKAAEIDIDEIRLAQALNLWLTSASNLDTLEMDLPVFVTLVLAIRPTGARVESCRARRLVVKRAYGDVSGDAWKVPFAEGRDVDFFGFYFYQRRTIVVDVFCRSCIVLGGGPQGGETSRWVRRGQRVPWQLAIRNRAALKMQKHMYKLGMRKGSSSFTPGPNGRKWEAREADLTLEEVRANISTLAAIQDDYTSLLYSLTNKNSCCDERDLAYVETLLHLGARIHDEDGDPMPLLWRTRDGSIEIAKLLIDKGADYKKKVAINDAQQDVFEFASFEGRSRAAEELRAYVEALRKDPPSVSTSIK